MPFLSVFFSFMQEVMDHFNLSDNEAFLLACSEAASEVSSIAGSCSKNEQVQMGKPITLSTKPCQMYFTNISGDPYGDYKAQMIKLR